MNVNNAKALLDEILSEHPNLLDRNREKKQEPFKLITVRLSLETLNRLKQIDKNQSKAIREILELGFSKLDEK